MLGRKMIFFLDAVQEIPKSVLCLYSYPQVQIVGKVANHTSELRAISAVGEKRYNGISLL